MGVEGEAVETEDEGSQLSRFVAVVIVWIRRGDVKGGIWVGWREEVSVAL